MNTSPVKGFNDYLDENALKRAEIKKILADAFERYGFNPVETPVVEYEEFVTGENEKDEAVSDIFKLKDKGDRKLALRYEFTFQLKRIMQNKKLPFRRYQIGEVFRDEPVSANRFRQFVQADADIVGISKEEPFKSEAEILSMTSEILNKLGIDFVIYFNNRKLFNEILEKEGINQKDRNNVIKEIDKMDKLPEKEIKDNLKKYKAEKILGIFKKPEEYFEKYSFYKEILDLKEYLKIYKINAEFLPGLARGLSYYNGTIFEVKTKSIKETITAGGSYEFNGVQCTGISFGIDRLSTLAKIPTEKEKYLVVSLDEDKQSIKIVEKIRRENKTANLFYGKPSKALEYANSYRYNKVIFVGEKEVKEKKFKVKDMNTGKESVLKFS